MTIRADVSIHEPDLSATDGSVTVLEITAAFTDRFYFGSGKHDSALMRLENKVIVVSLSIGRHHLFITHNDTIMMAPPNSTLVRRAGFSLQLNIYMMILHLSNTRSPGRNPAASCTDGDRVHGRAYLSVQSIPGSRRSFRQLMVDIRDRYSRQVLF